MNSVINKNGTKFWYNSDGEYHREDGPAIEHAGGSKEWCKHGKWHREDGPAVEYANGSKEWYKHGKLHREDGPALEYIIGYKKYYLEDIEYKEEEYWEKIKELKKCKLFKLKNKRINWI